MKDKLIKQTPREIPDAATIGTLISGEVDLRKPKPKQWRTCGRNPLSLLPHGRTRERREGQATNLVLTGTSAAPEPTQRHHSSRWHRVASPFISFHHDEILDAMTSPRASDWPSERLPPWWYLAWPFIPFSTGLHWRQWHTYRLYDENFALSKQNTQILW